MRPLVGASIFSRMRHFAALVGLWTIANANAAEWPALVIDEAIGPATVLRVERALDEAARAQTPLWITLDTPGGLLASTQRIVKRLLEADVPVIIWVPPGGRAASAGLFILLSAHVAAAASSAHMGAATPIALGAPGGGKKPSTLERKALEDAAAFIRAIAKKRGRNAEWAEKAVREAQAIEAPKALALGVIDMVADSERALLAKLEGVRVQTGARTWTLHAKDATLHALAPSLRERVLAAVGNPEVAYLLLVLGFYGLLFELLHPGGVVPGVLGGIAFLLGLYGMQALSVDIAGIALLLLGIALMVAEIFAPGFGILGISGAIAFLLGSLMLFEDPWAKLPWALAGGVAAASFVFISLVLGAAVRARRRKPSAGAEAEIGAIVVADEDFADTGRVRHQGELWQAHTTAPLRKGEKARIIGREGLKLRVEPIGKEET